MYQQSNLSLTSITSDELRWLDADMILQESSTIEPPTSPSSYSPHNNGATTFPRHKNTKRHHYQRSTKSSSAKAVSRMSGSFNRRHSRTNLNYILTPPVSVPPTPSTGTIECPPITMSASLPVKTTPRLPKRTGSYSSTHGGSPSCSEWIYRRPKSPSACTPPSASAIRLARRTVSDSTAGTSTPSPASTADNSRCVTPTSGTYRSGLAASYFPDVSTSCLNLSSASLPAHLINSSLDANMNSSGSSIGSIGSIGVLVPSTFGFNSSTSNLSRKPSGTSKASETSGEKTFWTSILHPRSGPVSASGDPESPRSKISRLTMGKGSLKDKKQPSSPLAAHSAIPPIWSAADLEGANGTTPKRRKGRGSLKELGISRIPQANSRITGNRSPTTPLSSSPPIYNTPVKRRPRQTRSPSISSTSSSTTSSAAFSTSGSSLSSTPPSTPISPSASGFGIGKAKKFQPKFEPHHRVIIEVREDESDMEIQRRKSPSPTKSILASRTVHSGSPPPLKLNTSISKKFDSGISLDLDLGLDDSLRKKAKRKDSVSTTVSSNKSVKFVEKPTVHYASAVYESWDGASGAGPFDYDSMGMDLEGMDMDINDDDDDDEDYPSEETTQQHNYHIPSHPYASASLNYADDHDNDDEEEEANDTVSANWEGLNSRLAHARALRAQEQTRQREESCVLPTSDRGRERTTSSSSTGKGFGSLKRKSSSTSSTSNPVQKSELSASHRPTISGPYALGSMSHLHPGASTPPLPALGLGSNADVNELGMRGSGLRSAPSLESFKSVKSGKSMRSLKSLPESMKSSISIRAKGMRDWFKGRVTVNAM